MVADGDGYAARLSDSRLRVRSGSPLLANICLHYAFDLWVDVWPKKCAQGDVIVVRYAGDSVLGFQHHAEADRFPEDLRERLRKLGLELHPDKTRRIEFGRFAEQDRERRAGGKPETIDLLGFTHISGKTRNGYFTVKRKTVGKRMRAKLQQIKQQLRARIHDPVAQTGEWLKSVVQGYFNYHALPGNPDSLGAFREPATRLWPRTLLSCTQTHRLAWTRMHRLPEPWIPQPRLFHPYPESRSAIRYLTQEPYGLMSARTDLCGGCQASGIPAATGGILFRCCGELVACRR
jgi:RNA-directed DNA polymerase